MARDLDLCRDEDVLPEPVSGNGDGAAAPATKAWACTTCGHEYDRLGIEERLIARVQKAVVEWQTQDLKCKRCRRLRVNDFMEHCGCSGEWVCTVDREDVVRRLRVLESVSGFYGLKMLGGVVGDVLGRI